MSNENFTNGQDSVTKADRIKKEEIKTLISYLHKKYSCEFPDNYARILFRLGTDKIPSEKVADAIILEWLKWAPYVNPESFHGFVQHELEMLFKIHTASTFGSPELKNFIGNKAELVKAPPHRMATTIQMNGELVVR